ELYGSAAEFMLSRGWQVLLRCSVTSIRPQADGITIVGGNGEQRFDYAVLAVPFQVAAGVLPADSIAEDLKKDLGKFEASPITGLHLGFDREITPLPNAGFVGRALHWLFEQS